MLQPEHAAQFRPAETDAPSFGVDNAAFWLRLRLRDDSRQGRWLLEIAYPQLQRITLYLPAADGSFYEKIAGASLRFPERDRRHRHFVFDLPTRKGQEETVYLRVRTESSAIIPVRVWERGAFAAKDHTEQMVLGLYYGVVGIMVLYNFVLFLSLRDRAYLAYVLSALTFILFQAGLNGLSYEFLWPELPQWNARSLPFFLGAAVLTSLLFCSEFLDLKRCFPRMREWCFFLAASGAALMVVSLFGAHRLCVRFGSILGVAATVTMLFAGVLSWRSRFKPARFFLIGWSVFLVAQLINALHKGYGVIPTNFLTLYGGQFGSAWEVVLLALALADRIRVIQEERFQAREDALAALRRTDELNEQLRESNRNLERRVEERTSELREAYLKLQTMDRLKSDFLANVSHELRTPLTSVIGFAQIIKQRFLQEIAPRFAPDDPTSRYTRKINAQLDIIVSEGDRLTRLINDVLDFSKLEAGRIVWNMEQVSLEEIMRAAITATQPLFQQKGVVLRFAPPTRPLPEVWGDRDRLMQVCINLLSNAVKFTEKGEVVCSVRRDCGQEQDALVASVRDTGVGLSQEDLEGIFEKFHQVGDALESKPQGAGLGLPISKQIVERHGGRIWAESERGRGSVFRFTVPLENRSENALPGPLHTGVC